jgi:hypothetical protein
MPEFQSTIATETSLQNFIKAHCFYLASDLGFSDSEMALQTPKAHFYSLAKVVTNFTIIGFKLKCLI